jgi:hypothetical protein
MNVIRLSALRSVHLNTQEIFAVLLCFRGQVGPKTHSATGRINSMKNPSNTPANKRTREFLACSAVRQPTTLPPAPKIWTQFTLNLIIPSNVNVAQRYIHMHTAHTVQQKVNRNYRSVAPLSGSSSNCTADNGRISSVKTHTLHKQAQYSLLESRFTIK